MNEIKNVRQVPQEKPSTWYRVWTQAQYLNLALTIIGQCAIAYYLVGQSIWLIANIIAVTRDIVLKRPAADLVKDVCMTALTAGLIVFYLLEGF